MSCAREASYLARSIVGASEDVHRHRGGSLVLVEISEVFEKECDFIGEGGVALDKIANFPIGVEYGGVVSTPETLSDEGIGRQW